MKTFVVATDFSPNANSAIEYALSLSKQLEAKLHVVYSFVSIPAVGIDGEPGSLKESVTEAGIKENESKLSELVSDLIAKIPQYSGAVESKVLEGDPVASIISYAEKVQADMIIMGTKGNSRLEEIIFGSTTVEVMRESNVPVLAIPESAKYYDIKKIVYACDLTNKDIQVVKKLVSFAEAFDSEILVFHVFSEDNMTAQNDADEFNRLLASEVKYSKLSKASVTYENDFDAISKEVKNELANVIAVREQDHGIFGRLFHRDMVRRINDHTYIPMLSYNDNSID